MGGRGMILGVLGGLLTACGGEPEPEYLDMGGGVRGVVHPTEEGRLSTHTDVPVTRIALSDDAAPLPSELAPLATFDETSAVGLLEATGGGSPDLVFGTLIDAEVAPDGSVLLLDGDYSVVRALSPALEPIQILGGEGQGPGEFDGPRSLIWLAPDEVGVFQRGRIEAFRSVDGVYEHSRRLPISAVPNPDAACVAGETLRLTGLRIAMGGVPVSREGLSDSNQFNINDATIRPETVHDATLDGELVRSFSAPYIGELPYDSGMDRFHLALNTMSGQIACEDDRSWVAYSILAEVHGFREDGLTWIARLTDFEHPGFRYMWDANGERSGRSGIYHVEDVDHGDFALPWMSRIKLLSDDVLATQVTSNYYGPYVEGESPSFTVTYRTYLLDPEDGELLGGFTADHQILAGRNGIVVLYREVPFPQISVVRLED